MRALLFGRLLTVFIGSFLLAIATVLAPPAWAQNGESPADPSLSCLLLQLFPWTGMVGPGDDPWLGLPIQFTGGGTLNFTLVPDDDNPASDGIAWQVLRDGEDPDSVEGSRIGYGSLNYELPAGTTSTEAGALFDMDTVDGAAWLIVTCEPPPPPRCAQVAQTVDFGAETRIAAALFATAAPGDTFTFSFAHAPDADTPPLSSTAWQLLSYDFDSRGYAGLIADLSEWDLLDEGSLDVPGSISYTVTTDTEGVLPLALILDPDTFEPPTGGARMTVSCRPAAAATTTTTPVPSNSPVGLALLTLLLAAAGALRWRAGRRRG